MEFRIFWNREIFRIEQAILSDDQGSIVKKHREIQALGHRGLTLAFVEPIKIVGLSIIVDLIGLEERAHILAAVFRQPFREMPSIWYFHGLFAVVIAAVL